NPLYMACLADEMTQRGGSSCDNADFRDHVPSTLQQMFERQAAQLTDAEQEMLSAAAVAGNSFSTAAIGAALGWADAQVEAQCESLVKRHLFLRRGVTIRFPDGLESPGYSFLHGLSRDALYRNIQRSRRSRLHGALAQAEEGLYASDPNRVAAELAGHFECA